MRVVVLALASLATAGWMATVGAGSPSEATATPSSSPSWIGIASTPDGGGYWVASDNGAVEQFGDATFHGDMVGHALNGPVVGMAVTPNGGGYWLVAGDGGIFTFGNAEFRGSTGSLRLNQPVVGMAPTSDGGGYWLVASDGGIFTFGGAAFEGSMGGQHLNRPIVGMVPTHDGLGYWLVASDGGVFAFGDAAFEGSLGSSSPASPIVNMAPTPDNNGYWLVGQDGTVYGFGDAPRHGSLKAWPSAASSLAATPAGGYWILTTDGAVHPFGSAKNFGSPVTGRVDTAPPTAGSSSSGAATPPGASTTSTTAVNPAVALSNRTTSSSVLSLDPSSGTAGGGDTVHLSGSDFTGALAVYFGTNASSDFTVDSPTSITAVAPVGAATVDVRVVMPDGTTTARVNDHFTYVPTGQQPITAQGQHLEIGGVPKVFSGFNVFQLATVWGTNAGCGDMPTPAQIDTLFSSLRPNSLVRFWAFQGTMATKIHTSQVDWQPLDDVFYAAAKYHVYLIPDDQRPIRDM